MGIRTDVAAEAKRLWDREMGEKTMLNGVEAYRLEWDGPPAEVVKILDRRGEASLGKPVGTYVSLQLPALFAADRENFGKLTEAVSDILRKLLPGCSRPLVAGLGNRGITPDAVGPKTLDCLLVTAHMPQPGLFGILSAVEPGVLAQTGIESLAMVRGAVREAQPDCVIVVDALASCEADGLCGSVQLTDAGIVPGSGIGNSRAGFNRASLGVPVAAIGVPTVMDYPLEQGEDKRLILSMADIDRRVENISRLIGYGINLFAHRELSTQELPWLLA